MITETKEDDALEAGPEDTRHVREEMREYLAVDGRLRLSQSWRKIWVPTAGTREAFIALRDCLNAPDSTKPDGLVITGPSDAGKSFAMEKFRDEHPGTIDRDAEFAEFPAIYLKSPDRPRRTEVYKIILDAVGQGLIYASNEEDLRRHTLNMVRKCQVKAIMVDELHDVAGERMTSALSDFMRFLKNLVNATERPFIIGGVKTVLDVLGQDVQTESRFDNVIEIKALTITEFVSVLRGFERLMPLRRPTHLSKDPRAIQMLFSHSEGLIGRLSKMLYRSCAAAIDSGEECLTLDVLEKIPDRSIRAYTKR